MPGLFLANGTRVTKASVSTSAAADPLVVLSTDLYGTAEYGEADPTAEGSIKTLALKAGTEMRRSALDALFPACIVDRGSPTAVGIAGGTVVTFRGSNLDGVTAVSVGGTAATAVTVVNSRTLQFTTPVKTAGTYNVVITDDSGSYTSPVQLTYA